MELMGIKYDNLTTSEALKKLEEFLDNEKKTNVFFLNIDCLYHARKDKEYSEILRKKTGLVLGDGLGLKILSFFYGEKMKENLNGTDFSPKLMCTAAQKGKSVFLLGGQDGVAENAAKKFASTTKVQIAGTNNGYFGNVNQVIDRINRSEADILFVGFGVPKQEKWIVENRKMLNPTLCIGVGGLFDYNSGRIKRAPKFIRTMHMEWIWRILMEPRRLFTRYFVHDIPLLFYFILNKRGLKKMKS